MKKNKVLTVVAFVTFLLAVLCLVVAYVAPVTSLTPKGASSSVSSYGYLWAALSQAASGASQVLLVTVLLGGTSVGLFLDNRLARIIAGSLSLGSSIGFIASLTFTLRSFMDNSKTLSASGTVCKLEAGMFAGFIAFGLFVVLGLWILSLGVFGKEEVKD
jgi:hypothetical protein